MFAKNLLTIALCASVSLGANASGFTGHDASAVVSAPQRAAATFSFPLYQTEALNFVDTKAVTQSNEYWFTVSGDALNAGVALDTTAPGATILVSRATEGSPLSVDSIQLVGGKGGESVVERLYSEAEMNAVGVFENTLALRASDTAKAGVLTLSYSDKLAADAEFVVSVKEKDSTQLLSLSTPKTNYLAGESLTFNAAMLSADNTVALNTATAFIVSPSGKKQPVSVSLTRDGEATISKASLSRVEAPVNGLYELQLEGLATDNGVTVRRMAKMAFALAPATAMMQGVSASMGKGAPTATVDVNVDEPGRYEVRAVLMATNKAGELVPAMETHTAQFLKVGQQRMTVNFDAGILAKSGLSAPYAVQHVRLNDQTRLSNLDVTHKAVTVK